MGYLLVQILVCLLIAGLIGLVIGWLLRGFGCKKKLSDTKVQWENKLGLLSAKSEEQNRRFKAELETFNNEWDARVRTIKTDSNKEIDSFRVKLSQAESELEKKDADINVFKSKTNTLIEEYKKEFENYKIKLQDSENKIKDLEENLSKKEQEQSDLQSKVDNESISLKNEIKDLKAAQENELKIYNEKLKVEQERAKNLELELDENRESKKELESKLDTTNTQYESKIQGLMSSQGGELDSYKEKLQSADNRAKDLEAEINKKEERILALEAKVTHYEKKQSNEIEMYQSKLKRVEVKLKEAEEKLTNGLKAQQEQDNVNAKLTAISSEKDSYKLKISTLENKIKDVENALNIKDTQAQNLEAELNKKQKEQQELEAKYENKIQDVMISQGGEVDRYKIKLQAAETKAKELEDELAKKAEEEGSLKARLNSVNSDLSSKLEDAKNRESKELQSHKAELEKAQSEADYLKTKIREQEAQINSLRSNKNELDKLQLELSKSKDEFTQIEKDLQNKLQDCMSSKTDSTNQSINSVLDNKTVKIPYNIIATKDKTNKVRLSGYVDSAHEHKVIVDEAQMLFGSQNVTDQLEVLRGSPSMWAESTILSLNKLKSLDYGEFSIEGADLIFKGVAPKQEIKNNLESIKNILGSYYKLSTNDVSVTKIEAVEEDTDSVVEYKRVDRLRKRNVKGSQKHIKSKRSLLREEKREIQRSKKQKVEATKITESNSAKSKDNLQLVRGIGKVLEKVLNDKGIFRFEQIASWSENEVEKMGKDLDFPGRIEREDWVNQAKRLAAGEKTDFSKRVEKGDVPTSKKS